MGSVLHRRRTSWVALSVALALTAAVLPAAAAGGRFIDDDRSTHESAIEAIAAEGITRGCAADRYCPDDPVTRGQMAAFLNRALGLPAAVEGSGFVDTAGTFFDDIERLKAAGITRGCAADRYCPDDPVTRGQMAAFLNRALGLPAAVEGSGFVDTAGTFFDDIERLRAAGITVGCATDRYCPDRSVTRGEMATFLMRALELDPIVPPPSDCTLFPDDNYWNTPVDDAPVHPSSGAWIATIGAGSTLHPDFGSGEWPPGSGAPIGIPFIEVNSATPLVDVVYTAYGDESDPGPMPIPLDAPIEGGPAATGDRHVIALDRDGCMLYELFDAAPVGGAWHAASGAVYDLTSNELRPDGWTSADAAGMPILPGLVTYDEVASGSIDHAIRFTAPVTRDEYVWPARHQAGSSSSASVPPMGQRFRLRADFDLSGFSQPARVILEAMQTYGIVLADNGSSWYVSGAPDPRWDNGLLHEIKSVPGSAFEAVDVTGWIVDPDSGEAAD